MLTSDFRMFSDKLKKNYFFYTVLWLVLCCGHNRFMFCFWTYEDLVLF